MEDTSASGTNAPPLTRRTRFVCISDTHNHHVKLPKGDVLIHAGDLTDMGGYSELTSTLNWLEKADFECKIVVAGNHDISLDSVFARHHPSWFRFQARPPEDCRGLISQTKTLIYLSHESRTIKLSSPGGPHTKFKLFASPLSPRFGAWGFMYQRKLGDAIWDAIPLDTDVLVTHCPPRNILDTVERGNQHAGCIGLREALWRVRPKLHVFGHIHEARGVARVNWNLGPTPAGTEGYALNSATLCEDPAPQGEKTCLHDMSSRARDGRLDNDGSVGEAEGAGKAPSPGTIESEWLPSSPAPIQGLRGKGGDPASPFADQLALAGRLGRRESCLVNAAIMTGSFHEGRMGKMNKPIVIDIDLPVWEE